MITYISGSVVDECKKLFNPTTRAVMGDRVAAIKYLRVNSGRKLCEDGEWRPALGLKECKEIVEAGFSALSLDTHDVVVTHGAVEDQAEIDKLLDKMADLAYQLGEVHIALKSKGYNYGA